MFRKRFFWQEERFRPTDKLEKSNLKDQNAQTPVQNSWIGTEKLTKNGAKGDAIPFWIL